jgi:hypothetical protein
LPPLPRHTGTSDEVDQFRTFLTSTTPEDWIVRQVIAFDWYDGPTAGVCELANPSCCFSFQVIGQRYHSASDDRLFHVSYLPPDTVERACAVLSVLGRPTTPVWAPIWSFTDPAERQRIEDEIDALLAQGEPARLIIRASDMTRFVGCWVDVSDEPGLGAQGVAPGA